VPYKINAVVIEPGMLVLTFRYARAFVQPRYLSLDPPINCGWLGCRSKESAF